MNIILPARLTRSTMSSLLNQVVSDAGEPLHSEYVFEFHKVRKFIEPIGVTFLHNLVRWLTSKGILVHFTFLKDEEILANTNEPQRFLDDCGFFEKHLNRKIYEGSSLRGTTVPIQDVSMNNFHEWLNVSFVPWIAQSINKSVGELATLKVCLEEIFNNVRDHAEKDSSCVFAQHYPAKNSITISIADIGVGIIDHI